MMTDPKGGFTMDNKLQKDLAAMQENAVDTELSLDELENVSGGIMATTNGDTMTITLTDDEYERISPLLFMVGGIALNKGASAKDLNNFRLSRNMVLSTEFGEIIMEALRVADGMTSSPTFDRNLYG